MSDKPSDDQQPLGSARGRGFSRRTFLGSVGGAGLGGLVLTACEPDHREHHLGGSPQILPEDAVSPGTPRDVLQFFNPDQARTVDAMVARLIPGTEDDPGAREAGGTFFIDHLLATHTGYPKPVYTEGPYAQVYFGDAPPEDDDGGVWVAEQEYDRYGWQSAYLPREIYRMGLVRLDAVSRSRFGEDFVDLDGAQQDELLAALEDDEEDVRAIFGELLPSDFFSMVRTHTVQGFFADPVYGGNRDAVGWRLVGFPGSRRSYSPQDLMDEDFDVTPQSLVHLPAFHVDRPNDHHDVPTAVRKPHPNGPID